MRSVVCCVIFFVLVFSGRAQTMAGVAADFIKSLDTSQRSGTVQAFDSEERFGFYYFPVSDRKGLSLDKMNAAQKQAAIRLLKTCLTDATVKQVTDIIALENILRELENRAPDDRYRDPGKYFLTIFGTPAADEIWGWRFEGHHVSFNFSSKSNALVSGTPGFLGANPAIVTAGPKKGHEILKDEKEKAFALLRSFDTEQLKKVIVSTSAPADIITGNKRKAAIDKVEGLLYSEMNASQRELLLQLIHVYVHRYKKNFADTILLDIKKSGLDRLRFIWAGEMQSGPGHPHYYRIQGPTIIIEYDNTQNNANHVHTVVRDLRRDFGGDPLLEHYRKGHTHK